jgi:lipopolysaccharide/colanic/teichoic acid biosynthesis glycosyltransferase
LILTDQKDERIATQQVMPQSTAAGIKKNFLYIPGELNAIRFFDVMISFTSLIVLLPFFLFIAVLIRLTSKGPAFFLQPRVGKGNTDFILYKFRTMHVHAHEKRSLTVGKNDNRITAIGSFLRRFKLDELPQLYNVLKNDMSIVGPRPELRKYVNFYNSSQREILYIKPGITDYASILFRNENELLAAKTNPEQYYIEEIIPLKIRLNKKYQDDKNLKNYFIIIFKTVTATFI